MATFVMVLMLGYLVFIFIASIWFSFTWPIQGFIELVNPNYRKLNACDTTPRRTKKNNNNNNNGSIVNKPSGSSRKDFISLVDNDPTVAEKEKQFIDDLTSALCALGYKKKEAKERSLLMLKEHSIIPLEEAIVEVYKE